MFHKENQGVAATKNEGIRAASGEYLIITDPDDFVELDMMEQMYRKAEESGADMVICDYYRFDEESNIRKSAAPDGVLGDGMNVRDDIINRRNPPFCVVRMFNRSLFTKDVMVWPVGRFGEDVVYSIVTAYYAKKIAFVDKPLYHYRAHNESLTHDLNEKACLEKYKWNMANVDIMVRFLETNGAAEEYWRGILIQKLRVRNRLLPIINKNHNRKKWFGTYPEINKILFWGDNRYRSTYREKIWFIAVALGLYPYCKNLLGNNRLRPFPQWLK